MQPVSSPSIARRRILALVVAVGAMLVLLFATALTSQAYVAKISETTLLDFASGTFMRTGLLDVPPDIDSVQLLPVGLSGQWTADPQEALPVALTDLFAVAAGGHLVVMGGQDDSFQFHSEVYVSTIDLEDGSLSPWVEQTSAPLPKAIAAAAAVAHPHPQDGNASVIYVLGGVSTGNSFSSVYYTTLHHDTGAIDPWIQSAYPLSTPVHYLDATAHNDYVYAVGGLSFDPPFSTATDDVSYAKIQPDGSLGPWQTGEILPEIVRSHLTVAHGEGMTQTLYVIGGWNNIGGPINSSFRVYFADLDPDTGNVTGWTLSEGNLPSRIFAHSGTQLNGQILVTGGVDATGEVTDTVKAALVDPNNPDFRLYDWCQGDPLCTIGAWETGPVLPELRAYHATVDYGGYVYTLGGLDTNNNPQDSVYRGTTNGEASLYSPWGHYVSSDLEFETPATLRKMEWDATLLQPDDMGLKLRYSYRLQGQTEWQDWSPFFDSGDGFNEEWFDPPINNVRAFKYRIDMSTTVTNSSPLLNSFDVYYEVTDPEVAVSKDTGSVVTVSQESLLNYTIYYTNYGGWVAENVVLTETLPDNTVYAGNPLAWLQVGSSDVYTRLVGNLGRDATGSAVFQVQVIEEVPPGVTSIDNQVDIGYPTMTDALGQDITDPVPQNNHFEFSNPFVPYSVRLTKDSAPPPGSAVAPGQTISYTLIYSNGEWAFPADNAYILDTLPDYTNYVPGSIYGLGADDSNLPELRWDLGILEPGTLSEVGYAVTVSDPPTDVLNIHNMATIYSDNGSPRNSNLVSHSIVRPAAVMELTKDAWPLPGSPVEPGSLITYTVLYTNSGLADAVDATVTEWYDPRDSYTVTAFLTGEPDEGSNQWYVGPLVPDQGGSIQFVVQVDDIIPNNWVITNSVTFESPEANVPANAVVTHVISYSATLPDLVVTDIGWQPANPKAGELIVFDVTIANWGIQDADDWFGVELYVKRAPSSAPTGPADHDEGYCLNNCTITRTSYFRWAQQDQGTSQVIQFEMDEPPFRGGGLYDIYAQVDVAFEGPGWDENWGKYPELHEDNNIHHETVWIPPVVYLPIVRKN